MKKCFFVFLWPLSLPLLATGSPAPAWADKYTDQLSVPAMTTPAMAPATDDELERIRIRAELKKDVGLSCDQIAHEVVELDRVIRMARITQTESRHTGTGVSVAKTVGSLLVGSLGGVVGIVAVGALAGEAANNYGEQAAQVEEDAEERQNRLAGIFDGKGCEGELVLTAEPDITGDLANITPAAGTPGQKAIMKPRYNE